jgi:hypothetical protein
MMKHFSLAVVGTLTTVVLLGSLCAQEANLEDRLPAAILKDKEVQSITEKLRFLRRNSANYGERHPNYRKALDEIAAHEKRLKEIVDAANKENLLKSGESQPKSASRGEAERSDVRRTGEQSDPSKLQAKTRPAIRVSLGLTELPVWKPPFLSTTARPAAPVDMPEKLSRTGIYGPPNSLTINSSLIPYTTKTAPVHDGYTTRTWLGLPRPKPIKPTGLANYPEGTTFLQEIQEQAPTPRKTETRILIAQDSQWFGFVYRWDVDQKDATLVRAEGDSISLGRRSCQSCHSQPNGDFIMGFRADNLTEFQEYTEGKSALRTLRHIGVLE